MTTKLMTLEESRKLEDSPSTSHSYWRTALAGEIMRTSPDYVPLGWFRKRRKDGTYLPVSIYLDDGVKKVQTGKYEPEALSTDALEAGFGRNVFANFAGDAITYEAYLHWFQTGAWPAVQGADAVIEQSLKPKPRAAPKAAPKPAPTPKAEPAPQPANERAVIGGNSGADADIEHETYKDQVEAALKGVADLKVVETPKQEAAALSLANRLAELSGQGDKLRVAIKAPHLAAGKAVDERWKPTIDDAAAGARTLKGAISTLRTKRLVEQRKREAAEAARAAEAAAANQPAPEQPEAAPAPAERIVGSYGKSAAVKIRRVAKVVDAEAFFPLVRTHGDVLELLRVLAQRMVDAGVDPAGIEVTEVAKVR